MFNRREILKYLGIGTAAAATGVTTAAEDPKPRSSALDGHPDKPFYEMIEKTLNHRVDELLRFYNEATEVCPQLFPTATRLPFGCQPYKVYVNVPAEVRRKVKAPSLSSSISCVDVYDVKALWSRVKPIYIHELPASETVAKVAADYFERKRDDRLKETSFVLRPDRINSPCFIIDRAEMDEYSIGYMSCISILVAEELHRSLVEAVSRAKEVLPDVNLRDMEGDCWMTRLRPQVRVENNLIEIYAEVASAGMIYLPSRCSDLESRRQDPWHWHKLPEELIKEVS